MAILKAKDVEKMDKKVREKKLKDLKMELIKANISANKTNSKTKEIKRAIARIITFGKLESSKESKKS
jgi:ribosomal protein L29